MLSFFETSTLWISSICLFFWKLLKSRGNFDTVCSCLRCFCGSRSCINLDTNTGKYRKVFKLSEIDLTPAQKSSLIGFHAFTGNDYNSAFFRKEKHTCWKLLESKLKFVDTFCNLGLCQMFHHKKLEKYVSLLYVMKGTRVNQARYDMFNRKLSRNNKITDIIAATMLVSW